VIRLLVVDDSALMRRLLGEVFLEAGDFEVAFARDGLEALDQMAAFRPHVVTLDVHMPGLNGLETLDRIMLQHPRPVVMVSAFTRDGAAETLQALELGAVDFVAKPAGAVSLRMTDWAPEVLETVRAAAAARLPPAHRLAERLRLRSRAARPASANDRAVRRTPPPAGDCPGVVLIGASTGGPPALDAVLTRLPADFPWPVVVAQHMPATFTGSLARRLDGLCALSVVEVTGATLLQAGVVHIARGGADILLSRRPGGLTAVPAPESARFRWHPSVDRLVDSALEAVAPERLAGVLLTGMGDDGAAAMGRLHAAGGWTLAEAEETAVIWGMPGELARRGGASVVTPLDDVADAVIAAVSAS
jgi:two-component system, chemotaxis family, protein-glutamate methylesterase/glutaminase